MVDRKHIIVVGAGAGGLSVALRLAHRGHHVTILEKNAYVGGRNRSQKVNDCSFDGGATLLMMLDPFRKLLRDVGEDFEELVPIQLCDPSYRVFFPDGHRIDATSDREIMTQRIRALAGEDDAKAFGPFLEELKALYDEAIPHFVRKNYRRLLDFASPAQLKRVVGNRMLGNLARRVERRFRDPRIRMLFSFQTMYLGLSPFDAPWVYATLVYMELGEGIWYPRGGMTTITDTISRLAIDRGAELRLGAPVKSIHGNNVTLESGETLRADAIVCNADLPYTKRKLIAKPIRRSLRYSCSALLLFIDYEGELDGLLHHNVLFGKDFKDNLDRLFHDLAVPEDPAFYVCISKRSDPSRAPEGHLNLFILIPVPNLQRQMTNAEQNQLEAVALNKLSSVANFNPANVRGIHRCGPEDWQSDLNLECGAAFGISHDLFQSAFMRPQNNDAENRCLFHVGASTVPGNGLPMVLISAELVEQRLIQEGILSH